MQQFTDISYISSWSMQMVNLLGKHVSTIKKHTLTY